MYFLNDKNYFIHVAITFDKKMHVIKIIFIIQKLYHKKISLQILEYGGGGFKYL